MRRLTAIRESLAAIAETWTSMGPDGKVIGEGFIIYDEYRYLPGLNPNVGGDGGMPDLQPLVNNLAEDMRVKLDWNFDDDAQSRFKSWGLLMPSDVDSFKFEEGE